MKNIGGFEGRDVGATGEAGARHRFPSVQLIVGE